MVQSLRIIEDKRIGIIDETGKVLQQPSRYVSGAPYNSVSDNYASQKFIRPVVSSVHGYRYFIILPMRYPDIPTTLKSELVAILDQFERGDEAQPELSKTELVAKMEVSKSKKPRVPTESEIASKISEVEVTPVTPSEGGE